MLLDEILESNRSFRQGRAPVPFPEDRALRVVIVGCFDPRLDSLYGSALGFAPGEAVLVRTAGALVRPGSDLLRSLAVAVFRFHIRDIVVVGHTSCRMASFDTAAFIAEFRKRGTAREAFGEEDLRTWAGALASPARGVEASVAAIRGAEFLPRDLVVAGLVMDDATGGLEVVVRPGESPRLGDDSAEAEAAGNSPGPAEVETTPAAEKAKPSPAPAKSPRVRAVLRAVGASDTFRKEAASLRATLRGQPEPTARIAAVRDFLRHAVEESREVRDAVESLRRESGAPGLLREDLLQLAARLAEELKP